MTKITFTKDQFKALQANEALCADFVKNESISTYFVTSGTKISVYHYGQGVILNSEVDVKEITEDNFFVVPMERFLTNLSKVFESADEASVEYSKDDNLFTFKGKKSTFTLKGFKTVDATEMEEIKQAYDTKVKSIVDPIEIKVTPELLKFNGLISKYMALTTDCNAVTINKTSLKYLDRMIIANKTASGISDSDKDIYLVKTMFNIVDKIHKTTGDFNLKFASDSSTVSFDIGVIKGIFQQSNISVVMPSEDEIAEALPDESNITKLTVNRADLIDTFKSFEGIFDASRKMSKTYVKANQDMLNKGELLFTFADAFTKAESKLPVTLVSTNAPDADFIISLSSLVDAADIIGDAETLDIEYSSIAIGEPHGSGIKVADANSTVYIMKFFE
jgi:hypothetical protein